MQHLGGICRLYHPGARILKLGRNSSRKCLRSDNHIPNSHHPILAIVRPAGEIIPDVIYPMPLTHWRLKRGGQLPCRNLMWAISAVTWVITRENPSQCPHFTHIMGHNSMSSTGAPITARKLSRPSDVVMHYVGKMRTLAWICSSRCPHNARHSPRN